MTGAVLHRVTEATFIELVLFEDLRRELIALLEERSSDLAIVNLVEIVASKCHATPEQLREAVRILEAEPSHEAEGVLRALLFHADIPEDLLMQLAQQGKFITELGHRAGPRALLELLAETHRYEEAVTTLALMYYGASEAPAQAFREFLRRFEDVMMLEYNIRRSASLDETKRAIVREVFGDDRSSARHGRKKR